MGIVTFGNRSFDNALAELCAVLEAGGFHTAAGAAFVGRHAFTDRLASGRPDPEDLEQLREFGKKAAEKIRTLDGAAGAGKGSGRCGGTLLCAQGYRGETGGFPEG